MLTKSNEDYLETILIIENSGKPIKSVQISRLLGVSRPAVNKAMNELKEIGLIEKADYGDITLTEKGRKMASDIYEKHNILTTFFTQLGVSEEIAEQDSCKIEHIISEETLKCIITFVKNKE